MQMHVSTSCLLQNRSEKQARFLRLSLRQAAQLLSVASFQERQTSCCDSKKGSL